MKPALAAAVLLVLAPPLALDEDQAARGRMRADLEFLCPPPLEGRASLTRGGDTAARPRFHQRAVRPS